MKDLPADELRYYCLSVLEKRALSTMSQTECKSFSILPLFFTVNDEIAAITSLKDHEVGEVSKILGLNFVTVRRVDKADLVNLIDYVYAKIGRQDSLELSDSPAQPKANEIQFDSPAGKLFKSLLEYQVSNNASDLYFIPMFDGVEVSAKTNSGELSKGSKLLSFGTYEKILNLIKVLTGVNFSPQSRCVESSFKTTIFGRLISFRISLVHVLRGLALTVRKLSQIENFTLTTICPITSQIELLLTEVKKPGIKLIAGPMGSGKTTLLYSIVVHLANSSFVLTIEDPPEVELPNICQVPVTESFDYATALRASLRHNPDFIALGELRDPETLKVAEQASAIGHSIIATIHAKDFKSLKDRLRGLGVSFDTFKNNLTAAIFPRLIPLPCERCSIILVTNQEGCEDRRSVGCEACGFTGTSGKIMLFEIYCSEYEFDLQGLSFKEQWEKLVEKGMVRGSRPKD